MLIESAKALGLVLLLLGIAGCRSFQPVDMDYGSVDVDRKPHKVEYGVYTPPGWQPGERLPLILYLHGAGDNHLSFERQGANHYFDEQINTGEMPRVILVSPNGKLGFWEDWADGSRLYRTWVLEQIVPAVQRRYNTLDCPEHCHLMGISMGGFGALRFAYFASDRFSSVSALSAPIIERKKDEKPEVSWFVKLFFPLDRIFGNDFKNGFAEENPYAWADNPDLRSVRLQLVWGEDDGMRIRDANRRLSDYLTDNGVEHDAIEYEGGHKWVYWKPMFGRVVNFLVTSCAAAVSPDPIPAA